MIKFVAFKVTLDTVKVVKVVKLFCLSDFLYIAEKNRMVSSVIHYKYKKL